MAIELVTAYKGKDHVTAEQWADFNRGIYGDAAILPVGNKMETAIQTANQITVKDGVAVIDGRQVYIGYGESENIAIQSGTQGKLRRDIVVLEYKKEEVSGVETVQFKVITGTPADSDAKDPSVQDMDIRTGVFTSQKPFCRVRLNGTAIEGVDTLIPVKEFKSHAFAAPVNNLTGTNPDLALAATQGKEIKKQIDALNSASVKFKDVEVNNIRVASADGAGFYVNVANLNNIAPEYKKALGASVISWKTVPGTVVPYLHVMQGTPALYLHSMASGVVDGMVIRFFYI